MKYINLRRRVNKVIQGYQDQDFKVWIFASDEEQDAKKDEVKPWHKVINIRPVTEKDLCPDCGKVHSVCACGVKY